MVGFPRRLLESALLPIMLSVLCALGYEASILPKAVLASGVCILIILISNYINMTDHLFAIRREDIFYKTNFAVFAINFAYSMVLATIATYVPLGDVYTFICLPYQTFKFLGMPYILSALLVNGLFALEIFLMPFIAMKRRR